METQQTITKWANDTFGPAATNLSTALRANEEMIELITELARNDTSPKARVEAADIFIVLYRLMENLGGMVEDEVAKKMVINRARTWDADGSGHGYHRE